MRAGEAEEKNSGVAAFFDLDGTLMALPSLERRFFGILREPERDSPAELFFVAEGSSAIGTAWDQHDLTGKQNAFERCANY